MGAVQCQEHPMKRTAFSYPALVLSLTAAYLSCAIARTALQTRHFTA
jgi:hypothetical protein